MLFFLSSGRKHPTLGCFEKKYIVRSLREQQRTNLKYCTPFNCSHQGTCIDCRFHSILSAFTGSCSCCRRSCKFSRSTTASCYLKIKLIKQFFLLQVKLSFLPKGYGYRNLNSLLVGKFSKVKRQCKATGKDLLNLQAGKQDMQKAELLQPSKIMH